MQELYITKPDDWHLHLRDEPYLKTTVSSSVKSFARALVMPNLSPPLTNLEDINSYRSRILNHIPKNYIFTPYMTIYLNEKVDVKIFNKNQEHILGAKLYPAGVTTNSQHGSNDIKKLYPYFDAMQQYDWVLQIHGEVLEADIFDREILFLESILLPIIKNFPRLRIVLEHISTKHAVEFVKTHNIAATITPHHLLYNRNDMLAQGIHPHKYCLPILKRVEDQIALQQVAISGNPKFFAGTDSAPHIIQNKESSCGCAGIFNAPYAVSIYTQIFEKLSSLNKLQGFLSEYGANFYKLPINTTTLKLIKKSFKIPNTLQLYDSNSLVVPIEANNYIDWTTDETF